MTETDRCDSCGPCWATCASEPCIRLTQPQQPRSSSMSTMFNEGGNDVRQGVGDHFPRTGPIGFVRISQCNVREENTDTRV